MKSLVIHTNNKQAKHLVIFVHGFTGNKDTFNSQEGKHFYNYLNDNIIHQCNFASFNYYTRIFDFYIVKKIMGLLGIDSGTRINHSIEEYSKLLETHYMNNESKYNSINFICHSMGGIIVKKTIISLITKNNSPFKGFYITLATPHRGLEEAKLLNILNNIQVKDLRPLSNNLLAISTEWLQVSKTIKSKYYCALDDKLVPEEVSFPLEEFDKMQKVEGTHKSIAKPSCSDSTLILNLNSTIEAFIGTSPLGDEVFKLDDVLFLNYKKLTEKYYYKRDIDDAISNVLNNNNMWISGDSGSGKTSIIQRYLLLNSDNYYYIDLSPCKCDPYGNGIELIDEIYDGIKMLASRKGLLDEYIVKDNLTTTCKLTDILDYLNNNISIIAIDEVSIPNDNVFIGFMSYIVAIINHYNNNPKTINKIRFIISTLNRPSSYCLPSSNEKSKLTSYFIFEEVDMWDYSQLYSLYRIIDSQLPMCLQFNEIEELIVSSRNSPRILKKIIRNYLVLSKSKNWNIKDTIINTLNEGI